MRLNVRKSLLIEAEEGVARPTMTGNVNTGRPDPSGTPAPTIQSCNRGLGTLRVAGDDLDDRLCRFVA